MRVELHRQKGSSADYKSEKEKEVISRFWATRGGNFSTAQIAPGNAKKAPGRPPREEVSCQELGAMDIPRKKVWGGGRQGHEANRENFNLET